MRVLVAPDKFAGTLTAPQAAEAIAEGWRRTAPGDELTLAPMADGGPGFVDVLQTALGGGVHAVTVRGPLGDPVPVSLLIDGTTAYVEAAQACGLHVVESSRRSPWTASSHGVGEALAAAADAGARRIVVGLGGSATNDGGAGLLAALGATADAPLDAGPAALEHVTSVDVSAARERLAGVELVVAADVETPLLGMFGATKTFGPQKGLSEDEILRVDRILDGFVDAVCGATPAERRLADTPSAGAAGGLGFALLVLGAQVTSGLGVVADAGRLPELARAHDLIVTGEGAFDFSSRAGKVVYGVATIAAEAARPCVVLAGTVDVGSREMRALGVESAYGLTDRVPLDEAMRAPARHLADLAARVARTWSTSGGR
ncbi:glycerate kinase [Aeromicrobium phragmitis]|uniref:Glycerate kinase n=1 Tax=Aeromicrobium phragmitis TaxID=2478914 RepID=A0A3L8PKU9_9ACTN|nr:glycerate kinase [Aeromicrobium phragmitis]RLV55951.1 glycerate kinase [Aeromicrobium phragmitis]